MTARVDALAEAHTLSPDEVSELVGRGEDLAWADAIVRGISRAGELLTAEAVSFFRERERCSPRGPAPGPGEGYSRRR